MAVNCTFEYKGKKYSKDRLLRKLAEESLQELNQGQSIQWLKDKLGMTDSEIIIVQGLIDNKSLGRFLQDGNILLSSFADTTVAYHEAFHRVFGLYLNDQERKDLITQFRKRSNWKELLKPYRELYGNEKEGISKMFSSESQENKYYDVLIEEYLADEFADYVVNEEYVLDQPTKSVFDKIINFIKSLLGLNKKDIKRLYSDIKKGKFAKAKKSNQQYRKSADKILIQDYEMSYLEKNEITDEIVRQVINRIIGTSVKALDDFITGKSIVNDFAIIKKVLQESIIPVIKNTNPELASAIEKDYINAYVNKNPLDSIIYNFYKDKIQKVGLNVEIKESENDEDVEEFTSDQRDVEVANTKGEFVSAIEIDPKSNLSKRIKVLLASFVEPSLKTELGFPKPIGWSQAFLRVAETLAGVPTEEVMKVLESSNLSFKNQLLSYLNKDDIATHNFRNDFISSLSKTINNFQIAEFRDGDLVFFNANNNTKVDKIIKQWESEMIKIINELGYNNWVNRIKGIFKLRTLAVKDIESTLGIKINDELDYETVVYRIMDTIKRASFSDTNQPDYTNLFRSLDIQGSIKDLATKQSEFEEATDLMVYAMGKRIYGLGLNTHVTTVLNRIAYAQNKFDSEMSDVEKLNIIKEYAPYVVSKFNVTYNEDGSVTVHNLWLREILDGKKLTVNIVYNIQNEEGDEKELSKLTETDLYSIHLNSALSGLTMSLKHSDRSIFYGYKFDGYNSALINPLPDIGFKTEDEVLNYLTEFFIDQIKLEINLAKEYENNFIPFQYFGKSYNKPGIASILGDERWKELLKDNNFNKEDFKIIKSKLVNKYYKEYVDELKNWKVIGDKNIGVSKSHVSNYKNNIDLLVATSFVNEVVAHVSENRLFNNDMRFYKNPVDFFKRLAPTSSTGQVLVNDNITNERIKKETSALKDIQIYNPLTNKTEIVEEYNLAPDGYMRGITIKENEEYNSFLLDLAVDSNNKPIISKLTGKQESKIFMLFEDGFLKDNIEKLDNKQLISKIRNYEKKYTNINENDGQSYMNIIAFKNYMIRLGQWTEGMENVFKVEMQIINAKSIEDIYDIEIEIKGKKVKVFEIPEKQKFEERVSKRTIKDNEVTVFEQFHPFHTLKTQYSGFSLSEQYLKESGEQFFDTSIFKTSQHILLPSNIIGTNLSLMNLTMIKKGIDIIHMGSANKVGGIDAKMAADYYGKQEAFAERKHIKTIAERGLEFYNENGAFNYEAIDENADIISYLFDVNFLKDQVRIGGKIKDKIKGSTQSLKIIVSNLMVNGKERFEGAENLLNEYKKVISRIVELNVEQLRKELDSDGTRFNSKERLTNLLHSSQLSKGAPENIINAIDNFIDDPLFEKMPNKSKIENILYSIVTNTAIVFNRPGNAYPQASITGYEPAGKRIVQLKDNNISARSNQHYVNDKAEVKDVLKFYEPEFDENGNVVKVNPAEIIIPLPDYWIEPILRKYRTRNIAKAITMLNKDIESGKVTNEVTVKGLRIPNQQFSSNDIFKIKKFGLPTMQAYVLVPSETVVKVGSDFISKFD